MSKGDRLKKLATLEFDRDRKSMSVLCAPVGTAPVPAGRVTRNSVKGQHGNVLFVKGASEVVLSRCSQVLSPAFAKTLGRGLHACSHTRSLSFTFGFYNLNFMRAL